jgi:hypothetical protein
MVLGTERPQVVVGGRIDALSERHDRLVVRDYKYARAPAAPAPVYVGQLAAYVVAVTDGLGRQAEAELLYVRGHPQRVAPPAIDVAREREALLAAGRQLGEAAARAEPEAFARGPAQPSACDALGCRYVARCWNRDAREGLTRSAPDAPIDGAGA